MPSDSALGPGTVLDGKYEILARIGAGGMGEVFKARHLHLNAYRCIKVMKQGLLADEVYRMRFLREARLATQIHHPNIAVVHDFFVGDGGNYMVTEFIDGTTLRQWSAAHGPFAVPLAADVAVQVLSGLDHIHRRGLLHRDISPDNVMLSYDADDRLTAKIIDLGIAKDVNTASSADTTQVGVLIGNPKYMSPEQLGALEDGEQVDGRADLYCLGVVLYEMLLGVPPFASETPHGYIMKHLTQEPPPFAKARPGVELPQPLEAVIRRALEKDRNRRYRDAREMAAAIEPFLSAAAGSLSRDDVARLRRGRQEVLPDKTVAVSLAALAANEATIADTPSQELAAEAEFQRAWEDGRAAAWRAFIAAYPRSQHAARAQQLLEEAVAFERAAGSDSDTVVREFLAAWPDGRHHLEAEIRLSAIRQRLAGDAFQQAKTADSYVAMRDFLARYPNSTHAEEAKRIVAERLAFETSAAADSEDAWDAYLETWGDDHHADEARTRRELARAKEEEAFREATKGKSAAAWAKFLEHYPDGKRAARAERNRREAVAFEQARDGGRAALQEFVRAYPEGTLVKDAQRLLRQAAEREEFEHARKVDTPAAWQLYLMAHPTGAHAPEAHARLSALEDAAFAAVLASKDPRAATQFISDYRDSPRRDEAARLAARWEDVANAQAALAAIDANDLARADALLARMRDDERRREVAAALEAARARLDRASEPRDFDAAWEAGTAAAWDTYLAAHPTSPRLPEARQCRQEAADFELATATDTPAMWRAFLKTWPEGRHRMDAAVRVRK
ncbi:MAG TPA: serine/threonine-protein kinase [Thermoanaerobaculia bacterium]|jgi:serine/threonine protein kinase